MTFKSRVLSKYRILATLSHWSGEWVHYTNVNKLGVNPKQFHMDLAGVYLFPKEFKTAGTLWKQKKYKYVCKVKEGAKVLDLAKLSENDMWSILEKLHIERKFVYTGDKPLNADNFWEALKNFYTLSANKSRIGGAVAWSKEFRRLGYDAVFDDAKAIHCAEVQLVVLNPKVLTVIDVETQNVNRGQYDRIKQHLELLAGKLKPYGKVEIEPLKKRKEWLEKTPSLTGKLKLGLSDGEYIGWQVKEDEANHMLWVKAYDTNIHHMKDNWGHFGDSVWIEYGDENEIDRLVSRVLKKAQSEPEVKSA